MADAAVKFVLDQLSKLIREEYSLLGGIGDDAQDIKNAFHRLTAVLRVADETEEIDPQVKAWVKIVRELAYDAEDVLDEFLFRFGGERSSGGFYAKINNIYTSVKNLRARRRLAHKLRRIKARVNHISQEQPSLLTTSAHTVHSYNKWWYDCRGDALLLEESDLVGIENPKHFLVSLLLDVDDDLRIHSVVGMGGLGKTTLIKKVYDDAKVINHFQYRVWVTISETFKIEELLKDATKQLVKQTKQVPPQDFEAMDSNKLKEFIKNILSGQRYIIVLDDIWDINAWMAIKYSFPSQSFGSRILITTRNSEIGAYISHEAHGIVYSLKSLSIEDSWTLFCRKTFLGGLCPQHLVNIAKKILNRCAGLPLAIVVIAGVLATKSENIEEWKKFQSSLSIQMESNDWMKNMKNPDEVFNLFQLKYLSLRRTKLRSFSKSIGRLQNLETLDLKHTNVIELPAELLKLCKLRHLLVYRYQYRWINPWISTQSFNAPFEIGGLVSLQKLCWIQANDILGIKTVSEIGKLTQLRRLGVQKLRQEDGKEFCLSLKKLTNLCSLSLTSTSEDEVLDIQHPIHVPLGLQRLYLKGLLEMVPRWLSSLLGLTVLEFGWCRVREDLLLFLEDLPMLAHLTLWTKSYEGEGLCFKAKKFSKLKDLSIYKLDALKWIRMEEGALHHLEEFQLGECKLVEQMPMGIQHLSDLKVITIYDLADKFNANLDSESKRSEIYAKISHIPEINISHVIDGKRKFFFL